MLWLLSVIAVATAAYWFLQKRYSYWTERGVRQGKTTYIFGDSLGTILRNQSPAEFVEMIYNKCPNTRYSGVYRFTHPILLLRDPELIKQITVKDFDHFPNRTGLIPEDADPLWNGNLFALSNQRWRDMRTTLSPAFTSSKMKYMFSLMKQSGQKFADYFVKNDQNLITLEMKDSLTRFTNDVIANVVFGVECDSLSDKSNEFYMMGKDITDFSGWKLVKLLAYIFFPLIRKLIEVKIFSQEVSNFFTGLVKSNIKIREKNGIVRPDMIHLLLEARKNKLKHEENGSIQETGFATVEESEIGRSQQQPKLEITDEAITAQALIFFFAGFDTVSSLMCFMSYELGINPDIQQRLIQEVDDTLDASNGELTYETLLSMKYMDMVISETLRKWPSIVALERVCAKPYTIEPKHPDEKPIHLEKNNILWVPVFAIHRDPQYWPDPQRFDPERFSDENKGKVIPYTYLPFGSGPRNCIGSRFALLETKTLFFYILSQFEIVPVKETKVPVTLKKTGLTTTAEGGVWFGLKRRVKP